MWLGIPFKCLDSSFIGSASVAISKLPEIHISSSPDMVGPILTVLGTLVAGSIPAFIAWKAISANRKQMLQQQIIINKQNSLNELRTKISSFLAGVEKLSLILRRDVYDRGDRVQGIDYDRKKYISELAYDADALYYSIRLLIEGRPEFKDISDLVEEIESEFKRTLEKNERFNLDDLSKPLIAATIKCIDEEWKLVTQSYK